MAVASFLIQTAELRMKSLESLESGEGLWNLALVPKAHGNQVEDVAVFGDADHQLPGRSLSIGEATAL